jgi:DDE_Tnp_1-associated
MEGSVPAASRATPSRMPQRLAAAFGRVPDPRRRASVRYALPAILTLAVTAILAQQLSVLAIAEWGARQTPDLLRTLGFADGCSPCQSTLQRLFAKLDGPALSVALSAHFAPVAVPLPVVAGGQGVAIDGKGAARPAALPGGRLPGACPDRLLPRAGAGAGS